MIDAPGRPTRGTRYLRQCDWTVVVAVITVWVVQVAIHEIVDVIAVGDCGVAAVRTVHMACFVTAAVVAYTAFRIGI